LSLLIGVGGCLSGHFMPRLSLNSLKSESSTRVLVRVHSTDRMLRTPYIQQYKRVDF
jgi:hypothetical protein